MSIQGLLAAYAHALDAGRTDDLVALFCPDGTAEIVGFGAFTGPQAIRDGYAALVPARPQLHLVTNTVITSPETAVSNFAFFQRGDTGWTLPAAGRYDDVLHQHDGRWFFHRRTTTLIGLPS